MTLSRYQSIIEALGFTTLHSSQRLQILWGGYGELVRLYVDQTSIVVKHVQLPQQHTHPRGWNTQLSHQRKLKSYQVEWSWYNHQANHTNARVPKKLLVQTDGQDCLLVMEDLKSVGYSEVVVTAKRQHINACLRWLAQFHAQYIGDQGKDLWPVGCYWHLATRPDEFDALQDMQLKQHAHTIDRVLTQAPYPTLVHGDAKLSNFCFTPDGGQAAAVDFQYVGCGCAMKDVALFISSAIEPEQCAQMERELLDEYFSHLQLALSESQPQLCAQRVEQAWRPLFPIAWADFQRFVKGWSPSHWKINDYTEALTAQALESLKAYR